MSSMERYARTGKISKKRDLQKAAGAEYDVLSSAQMIQSEKTDMENLGNIQSTLVIACRYKNKKIVNFNAHIWGL